MKLPLRIHRFLTRHSLLKGSMVYRHSDRLVQEHLQDPSFPVLISFPRTGSHQLRSLLERYAQKPSLPRIFYYKKARSFTCCHMHDLIPPDRQAGIERKRVIYLYRDPIPTIRSVLQYYQEDPMDPQRVLHWSSVYREHLRKWLLNESFSEEKVLIRYEELQAHPWESFQALCPFLGLSFDQERFQRIFRETGKESVRRMTSDNPSIVEEQQGKERLAKKFEEEMGDRVRQTVFGKIPELLAYFPTEGKGT